MGTGMLRENHLVHRESVNFEPQLLKHSFLDWLFLVMKIRFSTRETSNFLRVGSIMGGDGAPLVLFRGLWVVVLDYLPGVLLGDRCTEKIWPHSFSISIKL